MTSIKKILAVYKELRDVVIFIDNDDQIKIRAFSEDTGSEEEREEVKKLVLGQDFKVTNSITYKDDAIIKDTTSTEAPVKPRGKDKHASLLFKDVVEAEGGEEAEG